MDAEVIFLAVAVAPSACHVGSAREVHKLGGLLKPTGRRFVGAQGERDLGTAVGRRQTGWICQRNPMDSYSRTRSMVH